jgi:predicted ester cyclase
VVAQFVADVQAERGLCVTDVDGEQHRASESERGTARLCRHRAGVHSAVVSANRALVGSAIALAATGGAAAGAVAAVGIRRRARRPGAPAADGRLIARWVLEEPWKGNWAVVERHVSSSYVGQDLAEGESALGPAGLRASLERLVAAFPDGKITIDEQLASGAHVTTRWTLQGTQTGELGSLPPSGKQVTVSGITVSRVDGDLVVEEWRSWDRLGLLVQLGAISEPARA